MPASAASYANAVEMPEDVRHLLRTCEASKGEPSESPLLENPAQNAMFQYWSNLPRIDGMPDAAAFNPAAVKRWLPSLTVLSLNSPEQISHRLVGTEVTTQLDFELTGANLLDFIPAQTRLQCSRDMHEIGYRPCGWQARHVTRFRSGRISKIETLYLPMHAPHPQPPRILGMHSTHVPKGYDFALDDTVFGAEFDRMIWIDIGFGTP